MRGTCPSKPHATSTVGLRSRLRSLRFVFALILLTSAVAHVALGSEAAPYSPIKFTNVTAEAGIKFVHYNGQKGIAVIREVFGPGVCVADFDGDGFQDIYFVNGRDLYNRGVTVRNALYRNKGNGTFVDVTETADVPGTAYGLGCVWGDYDNDGFPDLYVTQYGRNVLYHNNGNGTFTDVTDKAGVAGTRSSSFFHGGATFLDYDRDGRLDLYVGGYVRFDDDSPRYCDFVDVRTNCPPSVYKGTPDVLYYKNGDGTFSDVTSTANVYQPQG